MLELRKRTGNLLTMGYAWIDHIDYDPSVGITLSHMGRKLLITGRNLNTELRPNVRLSMAVRIRVILAVRARF